MRTASLAIVLSLVSGSVAMAQPGQSSPPPPTAGAPMPIMQPPPAPPPPPRPARSAGVGVTLGIAGTILPAVAFGIGIEMDDVDVGSRVAVVALVGGLVLPGAGMYYAGRKKTIGQYPRSAALITLLLGLLIDGLGDNKSADSYYAVAGGLYVIGSGIDIVMTPSAVADYNARHAAPVAVGPIAVPGGGGLALGGSF